MLIISAGEQASKDLLAEVARLASSPLLAGSITDSDASLVRLSNGSVIRSVPASEKQVRGRAVDVLILDEACFITDELWAASRYTIVARPGSKVLMASTPWGRPDRFFAQAFRAGNRHEVGYASFHWPSQISPLVDTELLELWRASSSEREYQREVEALWVDDAGAFFKSAEIEAATVDYDLVPPAAAHGRVVVGGIDWGFARDSSALVLLAVAGDGDLPGAWPNRTFFVPWMTEGIGVPYGEFVRRVVDATAPGRYVTSRLASECNGVGAMPTEEIRRLMAGRPGVVVGVTTTSASKQESFGRLRLLLEQGRLALPSSPGSWPSSTVWSSPSPSPAACASPCLTGAGRTTT